MHLFDSWRCEIYRITKLCFNLFSSSTASPDDRKDDIDDDDPDDVIDDGSSIIGDTSNDMGSALNSGGRSYDRERSCMNDGVGLDIVDGHLVVSIPLESLPQLYQLQKALDLGPVRQEKSATRKAGADLPDIEHP